LPEIAIPSADACASLSRVLLFRAVLLPESFRGRLLLRHWFIQFSRSDKHIIIQLRRQNKHLLHTRGQI